MRNRDYVKWIILLAVIFSILSVCLYAEVDESDKMDCAISERRGQ